MPQAGRSDSPSTHGPNDVAFHLHFSVIRDRGIAWRQLHGELTQAGIPLPVEAHADFPDLDRHRRVLLALRDGDGQPRWGGVIALSPSRMLPGWSIGRGLRVCCIADEQVRARLVDLLVNVGKTERMLRLHLELSESDTSARRAFSEDLCARGFHRIAVPRQYERTIRIDLQRSDDEMLSAFHPTCRRHLRGFAKHPLRCEPVSSPELAARLAALDAETMQRTGGVVEALSWPDMLRYVRDHSAHATLLGVMRTDRSDAETLVGYVLGVRHGDTVEYRRAASTRLTDLRAPLLYTPTWHLMQWGRRHGARWFDFGGVGDGSHATGEATGGISDFKRYFCDEAIDIGAEVAYSAYPLLDRLVRSVATGRRALASLIPGH